MSTKSGDALSFVPYVELDELIDAIPLYGTTITPIIQSEPGVGKSTLLSLIAERNGDAWRRTGDVCPDDKYDYIYVDCPVKDLGDVGMNIPVHASKQLEYYASELFMLNSPRPKIIMLDEFMKSPKLLQIMFTRLMRERVAGDIPLTKGSIVFGTSNNQTDGVGDGMMAHAGNRVMMFRMRKPNAIKWNAWAGKQKISRSIRAWVAMNSQCLASYLDGGQEDNPYIFKPNKMMLSFVSPRSLAELDTVMRNAPKVSANMTLAAACGTVGEAAAKAIVAFLSIEKELISTEDVIKDPTGVAIPEKLASQFLMMFNAIDTITTQDELSSFMTFINRLPSSEVKSVFFTMLFKTQRTMRLAKNNEQVNAWGANNLDLIS